MRSTGNNNQFFGIESGPLMVGDSSDDNSSQSEQNTLWLNLLSDNGVFSQTVISYVDKATDGDDGWYFDTPKNLSSEQYSIIYTWIDSPDDKYTIQAKAPETLTETETIPIIYSHFCTYIVFLFDRSIRR